MNKLSRWVARACPEFFSTRISRFAVCGWPGRDQRHLWSTPLSKFRSTCAGISASPQSLVQKMAAFKSCALPISSFAGSFAAPHRVPRAAASALQKMSSDLFQRNHSQNGPQLERTRPRFRHGRDSHDQCCGPLQVCLWLRHAQCRDAGRHGDPQMW